MNPICVPPEALKDEEAFTAWFRRMKSSLFLAVDPNETSIDALTSTEVISRKFDIICRYYNLIFNGTDNTTRLDKTKRKHNSKTIDVVSTACVIILERFNVTLMGVGSAVSLNHSTLIYYRKRHTGRLAIRDFRSKYLRLIQLLEHERIIPAIKTEESESERVLSAILP
jgi:hypothetical protein